MSEQHLQWLDPEYFPLVAQMSRNPRYVNKRIMDPQLKCFVDECGIEIPPEWGLPVPNADASYKSLAKYAKDMLPMSEDMVDDMNLAWEFTTRHFGLYMSDSKIISAEEAKAHLDMSTSSGAPFNTQDPIKKDLFEHDPDLMEWLEEDWDRLADDPDWTCMWTNSLKEELRTKEKMDENSIRTFLSAGVDAIMHGTRLFVDMNEKMYASHLKSASAVGMSPYKGNWDLLFRKLKNFKDGFALDESQYDSSLRAFLMWGCARFRFGMLRLEDRTVRNFNRIRTYYRNLINSLVIGPDGVIIMKKGGNPSGSCNTITDNTLILYCLLAYAWIRNAPVENRNYVDFELHTAKCLVGDDNTWTVSETAVKYYNARTVIEQWKCIGITTTTDSLEPRRPEELDFLSAHTVFLGGKAVPVYSRVKLMTSLLYAPREHHTPATTLERTAAMLSVGWTDLPFRKFCREVISWLLTKYDRVLNDDPRWIMAKCQIQTDDRYYGLYMGESMLLRPQRFAGTRVQLLQPAENVKMSVNQNKGALQQAPGNNKPNKPRRRRRGPSGAPRAPATSNSGNNSRRRAPNQPRNRRQRRRMLTGRGSPMTPMRSKKMCVVEEDEYIAAVSGSPGFVNTAYPINPGNATTFPWLSVQAKQWEKYHFDYLEFYYKREVSEFATNGTTGKIIMNVDFDASDAPPVSKVQIEDSDPRVDGMPCQNLRLPLKQSCLHSLLKQLYVRTGGLPGASDIKTFDAGNLNIATQGCQDTTEIGELRVKYRVTFSVPVLDSTSAAPANHSVTQLMTLPAAAFSLTTNIESIIPFATVITNGLGAVNTAGSIVLPAGNYLIDVVPEYAFSGSGTSTVLDVYKNSVSVTGNAYNTTFVAAQLTRVTMPVSAYITSNGSDAFTVGVTGIFTTGTLTVNSSLRIVAI